MNELKYFVLGFLAWYGIQIIDVIMSIINSHSAILVTKCQVKINELGGGEEAQDPYCVGFRYEPQEEEYEIEGDYIDKAKK